MSAVLSQLMFLVLIQPIVLTLLCKTSVFLPNFIHQIIAKLLYAYMMSLKNQNQMSQILRWKLCTKQVRRFIEMVAVEQRSNSSISQQFKRVETRLIK